MSEQGTPQPHSDYPSPDLLSEPDDLHHPDGTIVGEPVVQVRCADCGRSGTVRVTDMALMRCVHCVRKAEAARPKPPDLAVIDCEGESSEQPMLPFLSLVEGA